MAYQKTIWSPGDTISSAKLNNMENGIAGLDTEVAAIFTNTISSLDARITELESGSGGSGKVSPALKAALIQLAEKVAYIDSSGPACYEDLYTALYADGEAVTVESLTAVLNLNGHTVAAGDSVDTLRPYLTVIAAYSDQSTRALTSYILAGTISAGTNTITVASGGKTTSFTVTASGSAPSVTLSNISAVLNLGSHTVNAGDSVDTLKPYLTVRATYSDSSTQTVSNYTLTGTIAAGMNTITVAYGGKTTTFAVNASSSTPTPTPSGELPAGYTSIPSLYCTGDKNCRILTGVMSGDIDYAEYAFRPTDMRYLKAGCLLAAPNCAFPYLTGDNTNGEQSRIGFKNFGNTESSVTSGSYLYTWNLNDRHTIKGFVNGKVYVDDVELFTVSKGSASSAELQIFKNPEGDSHYFIGRLYWMRFYKNGSLYRNFLPCRNSSNALGLYDTVTGTFITDTDHGNEFLREGGD